MPAPFPVSFPTPSPAPVRAASALPTRTERLLPAHPSFPAPAAAPGSGRTGFAAPAVPPPPAHGPPVRALLRRYADAGEPLSCVPVAQGLLNRGYRLATTRGAYFLKQHLDAPTADRETIVRQHRATQRLHGLGVPVAPPLPDAEGRTVAVIGGHCYALHPWVEGRHRGGAQLTPAGSRRLGALLGLVHTCLERVMEPEAGPALPAGAGPGSGPDAGPGTAPGGAHRSADPEETLRLIGRLLTMVRDRRPRGCFDELAEHRLLERRRLLAEQAHRRPPPAATGGWVHGDFHPLNLLYRGAEPAAIVDWDRLGVQPRAEEAVRAAVIFFVQPDGRLDLTKVRAYARAYRRAAGAAPGELAAAAHRVWWERLNDFWILRWRYELGDSRPDAQFPAASALVVWWTREYEAVRAAFAG